MEGVSKASVEARHHSSILICNKEDHFYRLIDKLDDELIEFLINLRDDGIFSYIAILMLACPCEGFTL